jgi:hypothetical protein
MSCPCFKKHVSSSQMQYWNIFTFAVLKFCDNALQATFLAGKTKKARIQHKGI